MKKGLLVTSLLGILVWATITWPIPANFTKAIPYAEWRGADEPAITAMVPGDHIQLLYHFWLCRDMIAGKTPPFANVYEFNTKGDSERFKFDTYYIPFSLVYAATSPIWGHAAGWNLATLFSHLMCLLGLYLLVWRLTHSEIISTAIAVALSVFPYRWITIISGSPTGFAYCLVPWLFYGLDQIARSGKIKGGIIAGLSIFFAYCSDLHVFYFSALATPFALIGFWLLKEQNETPLKKIVIALIPLAALGVAAVALSQLSASHLETSNMANGRTLQEIALFSPIKQGLFSRRHLSGAFSHNYIGISFLAMALLAIAFIPSLGKLTKEWKRYLALTLFGLMTLGVILLALGVDGPMCALPLRAARRLVPKYTMIRQAAKIYCLLPTVIAVFVAITSSLLARKKSIDATIKSKIFIYAATIIALVMTVEYMTWFRIRACQIKDYAQAYQAVTEKAPQAASPKAICLPIWPGESHWSSVYEHGAMNSRLRLINGYSPSVPQDYYPEVFGPLSSLNEGELTDEQIARLRKFGVTYILFHEQPYPTKVSPFPAGVALKKLAASPWLNLITQSEGITAFEILPQKKTDVIHADSKPLSYLNYPASVQWDSSKVLRSIQTARQGEINLKLRAPTQARQGMRYLILDKENGWHEAQFDPPLGGSIPLPKGVSTPIHALISAGEYPLKANSTIEIIPANMYHNGTSVLKDGSVEFNTAHTPKGEALHGPYLPIPQGKYRLEVKAQGGDGCQLKVGVAGGNEYGNAPFISSPNGLETATLDFTHTTNLPFRFAIIYDGKSNLTIKNITLTSL